MEQREDFFVQVTLSPEQARAVVRAIDVYMRIHMGQFGIIWEQFVGQPGAQTDIADKLLFEARRHLLPELGAAPGYSLGIRGASRSARVAHDVLQVIRQTEAYGRNPEGGYSVVFDDPLWSSDSEPRPKAKRINILERLSDDL